MGMYPIIKDCIATVTKWPSDYYVLQISTGMVTGFYGAICEGWPSGGPLLALKMQVCFGLESKKSGGNIDFWGHQFAPSYGPFYASHKWLFRDA